MLAPIPASSSAYSLRPRRRRTSDRLMRPVLKPVGINEIQDVRAAATVMVEANTRSMDRNTG